jgi:hypothetical protein
MSKKLTLEDRYYVSMYARKLECTLKLRFAIDNFLDQIAITQDEIAKYKVDVDRTTMQFNCNDSDYSVEYDEFPEAVIEAMSSYIGMYDHDKNKENLLLQRTFEFYKKIV